MKSTQTTYGPNCWHTPDKPCHDFVECIGSGKPLQDHPECLAGNAACTAIAGNGRQGSKIKIYIGMGSCGIAAGALTARNEMAEFLGSNHYDYEMIDVGCIGLCSAEPLVDIQMPGRVRLSFKNMIAPAVKDVLGNFFGGGLPETNILGQYRDETLLKYENIPFIDEIPYFGHQARRVTADCGIDAPTDIYKYIARNGFRALSKALGAYRPAELCDLIEHSGLAEPGSDAAPVATSWRKCQSNETKERYLICNAGGADPSGFAWRTIVEGDPGRLVEGIALAAYCIGASTAYVYIGSSCPLAVKRLNEAIRNCRKIGLNGNNILDSGFNLEIVICKGSGACAGGDATALINCIEGKRGASARRTAYPGDKGLFARPTVISNAETLANLPLIVFHGAEWFKSSGCGPAGTSIFSLAGDIACSGTVEVPRGTPLGKIINDIGGGTRARDGKSCQLKAVLIGGPAGAIIAGKDLDDQVVAGSPGGIMLGSPSIVAIGQERCIVDIVKSAMEYVQTQSCGRCIPCREGSRNMYEILDRISGSVRDNAYGSELRKFQSIMHIGELASVMKSACACNFGKSAPDLVLDALDSFRDEFEVHVYDKKCPGGVCRLEATVKE